MRFIQHKSIKPLPANRVRIMNIYELIHHLFNGNETARSMRYSSFVIIAGLVAGYYGIINSETVTSIVTASMGYIFGKARSETHVIQPIERRSEP